MNDGPAPTLPRGQGFQSSAWPTLDPHSRLLLVNEILAARPDLHIDGAIDPERSLEPVFTDKQGRFISIAGEVVSQPSTGLVVDITRGTIIPVGGEPRDNRLLFIIAGIAVLAIILIIR